MSSTLKPDRSLDSSFWTMALSLLFNIPEEHIDNECIDRPLMINIQNPPEILQGLRRLLILHRKHKLKEAPIVHLPLESLVLLVNSINQDAGEAPRILCKFGFL